MKYRNKYTGTIAEPSAEVEALNFAHNSDWVEIREDSGTPPDEAETSEDEGEALKFAPDSYFAKLNNSLNAPPGEAEIPKDEGEEENECSQSEQTATFQSDMPMSTSEDTTESQVPTETDGKPSARKKGKSTSKPPVKN